MSWLASIVVAFITALAGALAAGYVAALAVGWYRVSSFEGGAGFMIVGLSLLGAVAGLILGLVIARVVATRPSPSVVLALAFSLGSVFAIASAGGAVARLLADVPPAIDGEALLLAVEIRFPAGHEAPTSDADREWAVRLSSASGGRVRVSRMGPLWKEDARLDHGRWVVPGAVEVFTSRGSRVLDILPDGISERGFLVPLPAFPGRKYLEWSEWLPRAGSGEPPAADGVGYRFKVVPRNQPVRTEAAGAFEIATIARSFTYLGTGTEGTPYQAGADFLVRYRGAPIVIDHTPGDAPVVGAGEPAAGQDDGPAGESGLARVDRVSAVAVLPGEPHALLVRVPDGYDSGQTYLLVDESGRLRTEHVTSGSLSFSTYRLTSDAGVYARADDVRPLVGRVDRRMFAEGGLYLVGDAVLDVTARTVRRFSAEPAGSVRLDLPPVALSPDGRSFARLGFDADSAETRVLHVIDTVAGEAYAVPIDPARTRFTVLEAVDPAWVAHYFAWERGADGIDRLVARAGVPPLPYRGMLTTDRDGYREYKVFLAGQAVADALVEFLKTEFNAESATKKEYVSAYEALIAGRVVNVLIQEEAAVVSVWMERGSDTQLVAEIARRFDEALATGRYDAAFTPKS